MTGSRERRQTELFGVMVREVTLMLARLDPVGLVEADCPEDEYDTEAEALVRRMWREARGPADVERIAEEVFEHSFGPGCEPALEGLGREVWQRFEQERRDRRLAGLDALP